MRARPPPPDNGRALASLFIAGAIAAFALAMLAAFAVLFVSCDNALSHLGNNALSADRRVKPIPIPADACPRLRSVRASAEAAGKPWTAVLDASVAPSDASWRTFATQLSPRLAAFERALRDTIPRVPKLVARALQDVLEQVTIGQAQLPKAHSFSEYMTNIAGALGTGYFALSDASDLVCSACGFTVAPPLSLFFPSTPAPARTVTTS